MKVSVAEAKNRLSALIKAVENGEEITICRHGQPVVDLVRTSHGGHGKKIELGMYEGIIVEKNPDWWKPMTDQEVEALLNGRY